MVWLCFKPHRQRGHLETAAPFTVPCKGREAHFLHCSHRESNPRPSRDSPLQYHCTTPAPLTIVISIVYDSCLIENTGISQ